MDLQKLWEEMILALSESIPRAKLITYFQHSAILRVEEKTIFFGVSREFYISFAQKNKSVILEKLKMLMGKEVEKLEIEVDGNLELPAHTNKDRIVQLLGAENEDALKSRKMPKQSETKTEKDGEVYISKMIDAGFTLRNFVVGPENQLAHAASQAVSDAPGGIYNPLFLYGSVGLGKTHLLQATANEIMRKDPRKLVVYLTTENFIAEVVDAIQTRKMEKVRQKYRKVDIFILDDIQFLAGKDRTQEIFFHLFNDLYAGKKQMIFSSDRPPMELELTEDRLKSRFSMGMIADIKFPDFETRLAIAKVKAMESGVMLDDEMLNFIAFNVHHSIREVQGVILQAKAQIELQGKTPSVRSIAEILKKLNKDDAIVGMTGTTGENRKLMSTMDQIVEAVCDHYRVVKSDVLGAARDKAIMIPRQVAMFFIKKHLQSSLQAIGEFFSGRDHTSVLHAIRKIEKKIKEEPEFWKQLSLLEREFGLEK